MTRAQASHVTRYVAAPRWPWLFVVAAWGALIVVIGLVLGGCLEVDQVKVCRDACYPHSVHEVSKDRCVCESMHVDGSAR